MATYLGIDYGSRRMGLATANSETKMARRHKTVDPSALTSVIEADGPFDVLVIGLPRSLDGRETAQSLAVRRFADDELSRYGIEIAFQDEAATSSVAEERLIEAGKKYKVEDIDAEAAAIILQDYLDNL